MLSYCLTRFLSLREVSVVGSSRFEQFGAFTYRLKVCRQLNIVFRCLMKRPRKPHEHHRHVRLSRTLLRYFSSIA
ncbi:hypothetical protein, partial [Vibrio cholerae]|uniref:hypothetical protein n=1 Tax=Vibrio cholerae TaxID=666 RepID=UPI00387DC2AF